MGLSGERTSRPSRLIGALVEAAGWVTGEAPGVLATETAAV